MASPCCSPITSKSDSQTRAYGEIKADAISSAVVWSRPLRIRCCCMDTRDDSSSANVMLMVLAKKVFGSKAGAEARSSFVSDTKQREGACPCGLSVVGVRNSNGRTEVFFVGKNIFPRKIHSFRPFHDRWVGDIAGVGGCHKRYTSATCWTGTDEPSTRFCSPRKTFSE